MDSLDSSLDTELLVILKQINVSSNNVLGPKNSVRELKKRRNILKNES